MSLEAKRSKLVAELRALPSEMRLKLDESKAHASELRGRPDLLWYQLLSSAATMGNSRGFAGLCGDPETLASVAYSVLAPLAPVERESRLLKALQKAKVRMPTVKAPRLAANLEKIASLGGAEAATRKMLALPSREEKLAFARSFDGIGEKYGRDIWMDIYDPAFRDAIAVDVRVKDIAEALTFSGQHYRDYESFFVSVARDANLEPWELDRLLYTFTDHFLSVIRKPTRKGGKRATRAKRVLRR